MSSDLIFGIISELISTDVTSVDEGNTENKNSNDSSEFPSASPETFEFFPSNNMKCVSIYDVVRIKLNFSAF